MSEVSFDKMCQYIRENYPEKNLPEKGSGEYYRQKAEYDKGLAQMWDDFHYICDLNDEERDELLSMKTDEEFDAWLSAHRAKHGKNFQ